MCFKFITLLKYKINNVGTIITDFDKYCIILFVSC